MKKAPLNIFAFDTEDDSKGNAYLFNFYNTKTGKHHTFKHQLDALDFVCSKPYSQFWATNVEYDIINLFRGHFGMLHYCYAGSKMIFAELKYDNIRFIDTMNHWKISVAEMGDRIGLKKLKFNHNRKNPKATKKAIEYCRRDTEITGKFLKTMDINYQKVGATLRTTVAATALNYFQSDFSGKIVHPFEEHQIDFFHMGYYGGRTEIFYNKPMEGQIFYHDVNSLYPSALLSGVYPNICAGYTDDKLLDLSHEGMASVEIESPKSLEIPYLPAKFEGKLVFPLGTWQGIYTNFELRAAKSLGYRIGKVYRAITFFETFNPFSEYIEKMYSSRMLVQAEKDDLLSQTFKDLMNHLYGKFAQKNETTAMLPIASTELKEGDTIFGDLIFREQKTKYPAFANCIWACYVTAYARDLLYKNLIKVNNSDAVLLYCDTDSIIYENKNQILGNSKALGEFKLENIFKYAHFKLPKLYCLKEAKKRPIYKAKGVPYKARAAYFKKGKAQFKKPNKLRETLRRNLSPKRIHKLIPNYWEVREKEIRGKYDKRIVMLNGTTKPIFLIDGEISKNKEKSHGKRNKTSNEIRECSTD